MIFQTLHSITVAKIQCFIGNYRSILTTSVAIRYKIHHHIRYVIVSNIGDEKLFTKNGLITESQPRNFYVSCITNNNTKRKATQLVLFVYANTNTRTI